MKKTVQKLERKCLSFPQLSTYVDVLFRGRPVSEIVSLQHVINIFKSLKFLFKMLVFVEISAA